VVIAGSSEGVGKAGGFAKDLGAKRILSLPVSGAFHTPYMAPARDRLRKAIAEASPRDTDVPIVSNVDALPHDRGDEWSSLLSAQLSSPVRWKHCLLALADLGVTEYVELGPGGVLTGMAKRSVNAARTVSVATPDELTKLIDFIGASIPPVAPPHEGEHLFAVERLVVSPAAGIFHPVGGLEGGTVISVGEVLGHVAEHEVRSPFAGVLQSYIALAGERVTARQPIAWLRSG
jgi:[acyl-carrier-protein] S-malonyltransferase